MQCSVCQRELLADMTSCIVCGASSLGGVDAYAAGSGPSPQARAPGPAWPRAPASMPVARENHFAAASLVCGLSGLVPFWVGFILCFLAVAFGIAGIQRAAVLPGNRGRGMAIAGLVLGILFVLPASCGL